MTIWTMIVMMITRSSRRYGNDYTSRTIQNLKHTSYGEPVGELQKRRIIEHVALLHEICIVKTTSLGVYNDSVVILIKLVSKF